MPDLRMIFGDYRRRQADQAARAERQQIVNQALYAQPAMASDGSGMGPPTPGGLLQDPTSFQNQLRFAGALEGAPGGGGGLLGNLILGQQQRSTVGDQLFQRETESQRREAGADADRAMMSENNAMDAFLELRRQNQQQGQFDARIGQDQAQFEAQMAGGGGLQIKPEAGTYIAQTPRGPEVIPAINSKLYREGEAEVANFFDLRQNFAEIANIIDTEGGTIPGVDSTIRATLDSKVFLAQMAVKDLAGLGVLSDEEREELKDLLPDPGATIIWSESIKARYKVFEDLLNGKLENARWRTQYWPGMERYQDEQL